MIIKPKNLKTRIDLAQNSLNKAEKKTKWKDYGYLSSMSPDSTMTRRETRRKNGHCRDMPKNEPKRKGKVRNHVGKENSSRKYKKG